MTQTETLSTNVRAQVLAAFPRDAETYPLVGPDNMPTPHKGIFMSDGECVGVAVKSGYTPHQPTHVADVCEASTLAFDCPMELVTNFRDGHHVTMRPTKEYRHSVYGTDDNIFPMFTLKAGYNGTAFACSLGMYRDACRNMMMLRSTGTSLGVKIRHSAGLDMKMDALVHQLTQLKDKWGDVTAAVDNAERTQVNLAEYIQRIYPMPDNPSQRTLNGFSRRASQIVERIWRERDTTGRDNSMGTDPTVSLWEAHNGIQGQVQHTASMKGVRGTGRVFRAFDNASVKKSEALAFAGGAV